MNPVRYLEVGVKEKQSARETIDTARKLLYANLLISDQNAELETLKDQMVDEQERLVEADRALREDALKFKSYQEDVERQAENA